MTSGLDDLLTVVEWLAETKTPPQRVAEAIERLRQRVKDRIPVDVISNWEKNQHVPNDKLITNHINKKL